MMYSGHKQYQFGGATLIMAMVILFMISLIAIVTAQVGAIEHRIAGNHYRSKQAYEAGQAGISDAIRYLNKSDVVALGLNSITDQQITFLDEGNNNVTSKTLTSTDTQNNAVNISSYSATYSTITNNDFDNLKVDVFAQSTDTGSRKDLSQKVSFKGILHTAPPIAPIISQGDVTLGGASTVSNAGDIRGIWAGGTVNVPPAQITVSDGGTGTLSSDGNLNGLTTENFFRNFFRYSKLSTKARATKPAGANVNENDATVQQIGNNGGLLWVSGNLTLGQAAAITMGTAAKPVIIVVEGNFNLQSGSVVNGVVYVEGAWNNNNRVGTVNGAVLAEGNITANQVTFDYDGNASKDNVMNLGNYTPIAGTWKDWGP